MDMIALALLLVCNYAPGVPGIDKDTALNLLEVLKEKDILER